MLNPQALQLRVGVDVGSQCHSVAVGLTDGSLLEEFDLIHLWLPFACGSVPAISRTSQCAPTARNTSGGRIHPDSCRFDLVADRRSCLVTGGTEAL